MYTLKLKLWHRQLLRFSVVGIIATSTHIIMAVVLLNVLGATLTLVNIGGFFSSLSVTYLGNALWSFESKGEIKSLLKFSVLCILALTSTIFISQWITQKGLPAYYGILITAAVIPLISFTVQKFWIFQK